jgi:hypothetical protein
MKTNAMARKDAAEKNSIKNLTEDQKLKRSN